MGTGIGLRIKELRVEKGLTMEQLATDMNQRYTLEKPLNRSLISRWEAGVHEPSLNNAKYLSQYFDVSVDYLIGLTNKRTPSRFK